MLKKPEFKSFSIKEEFACSIEDFIRAHPEFGYRSIAQFLEDSSRRRLEELKINLKTLPRFEPVNCDPEGCKILDRQIKRVVDVYIRPEGIKCSLHHTDTCEHVEFALTLKDVTEIIKKKKKEGWKLPDV